MRQDNRHLLWETEDHPSPELLQQYQENALPPGLSHQLEKHVLDCALCSDVLEGLAVSDAGTLPAAEKELNRRIAATFRSKKQKFLPVYLSDWRVAAALAMLFCTTVLVFYYNYSQIAQQEQGIASVTDKAIQEAMDLGEAPAAAAPVRIADAVPDTVRQTIAANTTTSARQKRMAFVPPPFPRVKPAVTAPESRLADNEAEIEATTIPAKELAAIPPATVATSEAYQTKTELMPETTSVARALQGRVAGVSTKRANSVAMKQVQGRVLSSDGQPLPGVAVTIKGTGTGVATDALGNFSLNLPADKATLSFNFLGFEQKEQTVEAGTEQLTVNMQVDNRSLSEVVVTGYRTAATNPPAVVKAKPVISMRAYKKYLEENIRYTSASVKGRVVVQATVSPTGALQNLQVTRSLCPSCDEEALRLIRQGPNWKPATSNGSSTEQQVRIVVRFNPDKKR